MTDEALDLEHFRERLLALRAELQASEAAGNADADTVELDQQRQGRLSRMDALSAQAMTLEARRRRRETLQRCEAALRRIDAGAYGLCTRCEEDIDPRRLDFDPTVLLCIDCASRAER
jgi:DnaK suppressor protein